MTRVVLDASAALPWCFRDEETEYTRAVQLELVDGENFVPSVWPLEIANALAMAERRRRIARPDVQKFLESLEALNLTVEDASLDFAFRTALPLAQRHEDIRLSVYDAAYLGLAIHRGLPLVTLDSTLIRAATAEGVLIFQPGLAGSGGLDEPNEGA